MHLRCPHCQNPIELVEEPRPKEVVCPSCGSSFQLEPGTTASAVERERKLGKFVIVDTVGVGGFGTVYMARDPELDRVVAVKVPRAGNLTGPEDLDRFLREGRSAAQLRHPGIVPVYEVGQTDGVPYLVSELVRGTTLADLLSVRRPGFRESAELIAAVADALDYAHRQGVVHRDVKPSNIMLEVEPGWHALEGRGETQPPRPSQAQGVPPTRPLTTPSPTPGPRPPTPRLMDFGLAKREAGEITMTMDGQVLGTPAYMSPEQAGGEAHKVDGRSDVYSLGVILYELLTGELPFRGTKRMLIYQVVHDEPRPPRRLNEHIPRDLETICVKAMAKEPTRRYSTAAALADDLRRWLCGEPILARPVSQLERAWRWCKRNPAFATGATIILFLLVLLGGSLGAISQVRKNLRRESLLQEVQRIRLTPHATGWSDEAWGLVRAAARIRPDAAVRDQAAATLQGIDATARKRFEFGASSVAWDVSGKRLLMGGINDKVAEPKDAAVLWNRETDEIVRSQQAGAGPVAFTPDGTPLQVAAREGPSLLVWNVAAQQVVSECKFSADQKGPAQLSHAINDLDAVVMALSSDGSLVAASANYVDEEGHPIAGGLIAVWETESGELRQRFTQKASAVAISPDNALLAAGDEDGAVKVWSLKTAELVASFAVGRSKIHALAFGSNKHRRTLPADQTHAGSWLLAAGDSGATVTIWDLSTRSMRAIWRSHMYDVYAVAFSPDGTLLASGGRGWIRLWDTATGRLVLNLQGDDFADALSFSPDGTFLAIGALNLIGDHGLVMAYELESGRGIRSLNGLSSPISFARSLLTGGCWQRCRTIGKWPSGI